MPDERTKLEKLQAMANQTASPDEAEIAREMIKRMLGLDEDNIHKTHEGNRILTAAEILGTPDREKVGGSVRMQTKSGAWATIDVDEMSIVFDT